MPRRGPERKEPTIRDVAKAAGVSTATAARALGGYGAVSDGARERVAAAAASLGYRPNSLARSMITGTTHTIGVVIADIENPFFARAVRGITDVAHAHGFEVVLANSDENLDTERAAVHVLFEKRIDGLIIAPAASEHGEHLADLSARGLPIVLIDRRVRGVAADSVVVDNRRAARDAVSHLIRLGHRRIAVVTGGPEMSGPYVPDAPEVRARRHAALTPGSSGPTSSFRISSTDDRLAGYRDAFEAARLPLVSELIRYSRYRREAAIEETVQMLCLPDPPTAFFATDNLITLGVFEGIRAAGRSVPEVSLVGFDDLEWTAIVSPPLTVVAQPNYELGVTAANHLLARIHGDHRPPVESVLETTFQIRASTASPAPT